MEYVKMDIELDETGNYRQAIIHFWHNGQEIIDKCYDYDVRLNLKQFALQENTTIRELLRDKSKVKVTVPQYIPDTPIPSYSTTAKYRYKDEKNPIRITLPRIPKGFIKGAIKIASIGTIAVFLMNPLIDYQLQKGSALKNQNVKISYYSENHEMSKDLITILGDYTEFDTIMGDLANENWTNLYDVDLNSFFNKLDVILRANDPLLEQRYKNQRNIKYTIYEFDFSDYFQDPVDHEGIDWVFSQYNSLTSSFSYKSSLSSVNNKRYFVNSVLDYVINNEFHKSRDSNGNEIYHSFNNLNSVAKYMIISLAEQVVEIQDDNFTYGYYSKDQILKKLKERKYNCKSQVHIFIGNSKIK